MAKKDKDVRNKFKPRSETVLNKMYEDREKRSSLGGGKPIFNRDLMEELRVEEFKPGVGENYLDILPVSFDGDIPYSVEVPVHSGVGVNNDQFICMQRFTDGRKSCFRCKKQKALYKSFGEANDEIVALYPRDRAIYLVYDRTVEYTKEKTPDPVVKIWNAPKKSVHTEIQSRVRDKKKKVTIDIADIREEGNGRTVSFNIELEKVGKNTFPKYSGFDLSERDEPIPDEVIEQLEMIINTAEKRGMNALEMFLVFPEEGEIEEAMKTETFDGDDNNSDDEEEDKPKKKRAGFDRGKKKQEKEKESEFNADELKEELEDMKLKEVIKFAIKKKVGDEDDFEDMDKDEIIQAIIDSMEEQHNRW